MFPVTTLRFAGLGGFRQGEPCMALTSRRLAVKIGSVRKTRTTDGAAIRARRLALGIDRPTLAGRTDVSASYIKQIELYGCQASDRVLRVIAGGLGCCLDDISTPTAQQDAA